MSALPPSLAEVIRDEHCERCAMQLTPWAARMRRDGYDNTALAYAGARAILALCTELPDSALMNVMHQFDIVIGDIEEAAERLAAHVVIPDPEAVLATTAVPTTPVARIDAAEAHMLALTGRLQAEGLRTRSLVRALTAFLFEVTLDEPHELLEDLGELFRQAFVYERDMSQELPRNARPSDAPLSVH